MTDEGANHKHESEMNRISYKQGLSSLPRQPGSLLALPPRLPSVLLASAPRMLQLSRPGDGASRL